GHRLPRRPRTSPGPVPQPARAVAATRADGHSPGLVLGAERGGIREAVREVSHGWNTDGTRVGWAILTRVPCVAETERPVMAEIALAFLWHQHQPYYPDDVAGENPMPWVRLHGVKDYYGMALHLLEFPEMRCAINLVPSLVRQLQAYTDHGATDRFLQTSLLPADSLAEGDCL